MDYGRMRVCLRRATLIVTAIALIIVGVPIATATRASADSCTQFVFLGARGSGEDATHDYDISHNYGLGDTLFSLYGQLAALAPPGSITPEGVQYDAVGLFDSKPGDLINAVGADLHIGNLGAYTDSVSGGTDAVQSQIESDHAECPDAQFILAGYSQGAQAVADALQRMPEADQDLVVAAAFFGDPYRRASSWADRGDGGHYGLLGIRDEYPEFLHGHVFSYCHAADPICNGRIDVHIPGTSEDLSWVEPNLVPQLIAHFTDHTNYVEKGDTQDAADEIAQVLGYETVLDLSGPLDIAFVIDSTGSMSSAIGTVKANVTDLTSAIADASDDAHFALVDYKDDPATTGSAYLLDVRTDFTDNVSTFQSGLSDISASGGGDTPEDMLSGIDAALQLDWRSNVRKVVVVIADAPGKDPEPTTGLTSEYVAQEALDLDPAQVYAVQFGSDSSAATFMTSLADATGGQFTSASSTTDLVSTLQDTIAQAGRAPTADAGGPYNGFVGQSIDLSGSGSRDASEPITAYDWDFNGDGTYDATTSDPTVSHTFSTAGTYTVTLRTRTAGGLAGLATADVTIASAPTAAPGTPTGLTATPGFQSAALHWSHGSGPTPAYYVIRDGSGTVLQTIGANPDGSPPPWGFSDLTDGTSYSYTVSAGNIYGESSATSAVSVTPTAAPRSVSGLPAVASVSAGQVDAYALTPGGELWSWGRGGSTGDGTYTDRAAPVDVGVSDGGLMSAGGTAYHAGFVATDGTLYDWGYNASGQLGDGTTTSNPTATDTGSTAAGMGAAAQVSLGSQISVERRADGSVLSWGNNAEGEIGNGTTTSSTTPVPVSGLGAGSTIKIATGGWHTLALKTDGTVVAWGWNDSGQIGDGTTTDRHTPVAVSGLTGIVDISAGNQSSYALKNDGTLYAWGSNFYGQLGDNTTTNRTTPVTVHSISNVTEIRAGLGHAVAVTSSGSVYAWGYNGQGEVGDNTTTARHTPVALSGLTGVTHVAAGAQQSFALRSDGTVRAWGDNTYGELGDNTTTQRHTPVTVTGLSDVTALSAIQADTFATTTTGELYAWGQGGSTGDGTYTDRHTPTDITSVSSIASIATGPIAYHMAAINTAGTLQTWGFNSDGQLGDSTTTNRAAPRLIAVPRTTVAAGSEFTVIVSPDGSVKAWGGNDVGQLGDTTTTDRLSAVSVHALGAGSIISVAAGDDHALALESDGTVLAWGGNAHGQLGDGTTTDRHQPVAVTGLSGIVAIAAGQRTSYALAQDGTVYAWGQNTSGELGDGTYTDRHSPTAVSGLGRTVAIGAGTNQAVAVNGSGTVKAWGYNGQGQLANDTLVENSTTPLSIASLSHVVAVAGGSVFGLALEGDGDVLSWGEL